MNGQKLVVIHSDAVIVILSDGQHPARATPAWRKIRASDATEGTGSSPIACILS